MWWWLLGAWAVMAVVLSAVVVLAAVMRSGQLSRLAERWWRDD